MINKLKQLIDYNKNVSFVIMVYLLSELDDLFKVLEEKEFDPVPPISLEELKNNAISDCGFPVGFYINQSAHTVSYATLSYWREYNKDIIKYNGDNFELI